MAEGAALEMRKVGQPARGFDSLHLRDFWKNPWNFKGFSLHLSIGIAGLSFMFALEKTLKFGMMKRKNVQRKEGEEEDDGDKFILACVQKLRKRSS